MWEWLLLLLTLLTAVYWYISRQIGYWKARGVHTLPGAVPVLGHSYDVITLRKGAGWQHCQMYNQAKGHPAVGIYEFSQPALLIRDLNLINRVLISDFSSFHDNTLEVDEKVDPLISKNPFVLKGQKWKTLRQQLSPAFSSARLKAMHPSILKVCEEFNKYMESHLNQDVDVNYVTGLFTSEVVAKCAFAVDGNAFTDKNSEFYQQGKKMWDAIVYNPIAMVIATFFPFVNKILNKGFVPKDVEQFFVSLIEQAAEYREKNPDKVPDNDYLHHLLSLKQKHEDFTLNDVVAQSLTFFTDGFETTSVFASFILYELTIHPDIQEALRTEVMAMESLTFSSVTTLPLMDRVFKETMRKYGVFSMIRECTKDCVLQAEGFSYPVTKGQHVIVPVHAIQRDPEIYPNPDKFDPDRFLEENVKDRHSLSFMGFGAGPRICIGNSFATCVVKTLIANILANFTLVKGEKTVEKMVLSPLHILPASEKGIWIRFTKHTNTD